ncbi:MAG: hypothetical protein GQ477_04415 [Nanohaloarchaea archaeon]|nr:hypothetical protein [Candidatus Nanohaloarchaea archaeon]
MRARQILTIVSIAMLLILSSSVYAFDISTPGSSQVGFSSSSTSLNFDLNGILAWTYQLIADFFGIPMEDMQIRGGYLFSFVIVPILLAYMMFFGIIQKLHLFDEDWINKGIPLLLALMLAPLGLYRRFFFAVTSFLTTGTATLLYIFLFIAMLGYGYRYMFASGVGDFTAGSMYIKDMKDAKNGSKKLIRQIDDISTQIHKLRNKQSKLSSTDDAKEINKLDIQIQNLEEHKEILNEHLKNRNTEVIKGLKNIIGASR